MTVGKRLFDIVLALILAVLLLPLILVLALILLLREGRPVLFLSERMRAPDRGFQLVKFRTMTPDASDGGASGGHKAMRITRTGHLLRRTRLDEMPQLWNILMGDMSFVGPRPPLRRYVERFPETYGAVLRNRPGVTGLATLRFHAHEDLLMSSCRSTEEAERIYCQRCVPRKAHLDLIYQENSNLCFDLKILFQTVTAMLHRSG
ncbi:sugar transferase [Celeribacter neptunius]|uniref:Sugar transferase involved in LPS biosynthesis (Colanic, teichoic acid) n=1 Tax=Celeribacter neptunius TaxID=588602 RepID=A0A1I3WUZ9_9RHOB|nr:sugar transferase [Celeribacter neptunius]SFK11073.1 Sugar transferase involved in LPS biosynthesis (colanic, teichoic acid) [Celeribacter neptunius]